MLYKGETLPINSMDEAFPEYRKDRVANGFTFLFEHVIAN
jgi:hypothetical protein